MRNEFNAPHIGRWLDDGVGRTEPGKQWQLWALPSVTTDGAGPRSGPGLSRVSSICRLIALCRWVCAYRIAARASSTWIVSTHSAVPRSASPRMSCGRPPSSAASTAPNYPTSTTPARRPCAAPLPAPRSVCVLIWFNVHLSCMMPKQFFAGSMNQAIRANPMSAIPSTVLRPGRS